MLLLFAILSVRFNIINSIHNFVNIESQNQYYYYVMFIIYSILTIVLYVFLKNFSTLRLGISNIFILIMIILYYMYQYNTITINLTSATYNTQTNTKYIYVFVLIFSLVFLALKKPKKKINPLTIIYLFFFIDLTYISFFIAMALLSLLGSDFNRNSKVKLIHLFLLGLFFFTQQQLYIFNSELIVSDSNSLKLLKVDNIFTTTKYHINNIIEYCYSSKNSQIIFDLYKNNFDFLSGSSKGLFEKNILLSTNTIVELYSYNFQKLTQTGGCGVFILLLFILIIAILTKIKKNINIFL